MHCKSNAINKHVYKYKKLQFVSVLKIHETFLDGNSKHKKRNENVVDKMYPFSYRNSVVNKTLVITKNKMKSTLAHRSYCMSFVL